MFAQYFVLSKRTFKKKGENRTRKRKSGEEE